MVWQIASVTGWTPHYILHKISWQALLLMLADAPRYVRVPKPKKGVKPSLFRTTDTVELFKKINEQSKRKTNDS